MTTQTNETNRTFGDCFMAAMCQPSKVQRMASEVTSVRLVTRTVHSPSCTMSDMMHGMVTDPACMITVTFTESDVTR